MRVLNNTILGKNFSMSGLSLKESGLYKKIKGKNDEPFYIFLTDDVRKITELMDVKFEDIDGIESNSYEIILNSPFFNNFIFFDKFDKNKALTSFYNYLIENNIEKDSNYKRITKTRINEILNINLHETIDEKLAVLLNFDKKKYDGSELIKHSTEYNLRNWKSDFDRLYNSFETDFDFKKFIVERTAEEIAKKFTDLD